MSLIGSILQIYPFDYKPSAPPVGSFLMYIKTDNTIYLQDSAGVEYPFVSTTAITQISGEGTAIGPGNATLTLSNSAVIGKVLTGFVSGPNSTVLATDTILEAVQKLQAQVDGKLSNTEPVPVSLGGSGRTDFPAMQILFGAPDSQSIDRSEFFTYDASIGLMVNQGGQMQTRTLEQNPTDPSSVVIADKVEVLANDVDGPTHTRMNKDYVEARKVLETKELNASMGFDGTDSWLGVSKTENAGNNISMVKLFPEKAQLFTVDIGLGNGPQPILPVEPYDLVVKEYVDQQVASIPAGPAGPQGPQGDPGPQGPQGPAGVVSATAPIIYDSLTQNISIDQSALISNIPQTDKFYVDGSVGNDLTADGTIAKPFKTIQACLNYIGQPVSMADAMRHIVIYIGDALTAGTGNAGGNDQSWDGVYEENLTVPSRMITMIGAGVKIGKNFYASGDSTKGNILKEYSSSRRFGASSSDLRACLTLVGIANSRDSQNRLRNGFHVGGSCRTSILQRNADVINYVDASTISVHVTAGQFTYPITVPPVSQQISAGSFVVNQYYTIFTPGTTNFTAIGAANNNPGTTFKATGAGSGTGVATVEPPIYITVTGTANYNGAYIITSKVDGSTFLATKKSGTVTSSGAQSGAFFESDTAGASGVTHDAMFVNCYMQGLYTCDDGVINNAATTAGQEVLYLNNTKLFTGIAGRGLYLNRNDNVSYSSIAITAGSFVIGAVYTIASVGTTDFTLIGAASNTVGVTFTATGVGSGTGTATLVMLVNTIASVANSSFTGSMQTSTFTYTTDDMGFMNCRFNSAFPFIVTSTGQTVRMDGATMTSFLNTGSSWVTNTPTVDFLDSMVGIGKPRNPQAASYTATAKDYIVAVTSTAAARTITLPSSTGLQIGYTVIVKDESGGAATNNITITRNATPGTDTIDGATSVTIATNYGKQGIYYGGSGKFYTI